MARHGAISIKDSYVLSSDMSLTVRAFRPAQSCQKVMLISRELLKDRDVTAQGDQEPGIVTQCRDHVQTALSGHDEYLINMDNAHQGLEIGTESG
jgi:hypothetical protein